MVLARANFVFGKSGWFGGSGGCGFGRRQGDNVVEGGGNDWGGWLGRPFAFTFERPEGVGGHPAVVFATAGGLGRTGGVVEADYARQSESACQLGQGAGHSLDEWRHAGAGL